VAVLRAAAAVRSLAPAEPESAEQQEKDQDYEQEFHRTPLSM
jgi:hypothetical protein